MRTLKTKQGKQFRVIECITSTWMNDFLASRTLFKTLTHYDCIRVITKKDLSHYIKNN